MVHLELEMGSSSSYQPGTTFDPMEQSEMKQLLILIKGNLKYF